MYHVTITNSQKQSQDFSIVHEYGYGVLKTLELFNASFETDIPSDIEDPKYNPYFVVRDGKESTYIPKSAFNTIKEMIDFIKPKNFLIEDYIIYGEIMEVHDVYAPNQPVIFATDELECYEPSTGKTFYARLH